MKINFSDTKTAFENQNDGILKKNYTIFALMNQNWLVKIGTFFIKFSLKFGLPVKKIIKDTIFSLFCGGESIGECQKTIQSLNKFSIGTILDYSVEGEDDEDSFDQTKNEVLNSIKYAKGKEKEIPYAVFKITGIGSRDLLTKIQANDESLTLEEKKSYESFKSRFEEICALAENCKVRLFIDAEETWIQDVIDDLTLQMMKRYNNTGKPIIFNTYQFYRKKALEILKTHVETGKNEGFSVGAKLVRGAYMEKERERAEKLNYADPINDSKQKTDELFDAGSTFCLENLDVVNVCIGTHNEQSCQLGVDLLNKNGLDVGDQRVYFAQLLGMSDNISYNLAKSGFNVAKYVPYGPIEAVMPYLFRRAEENTSIAGQSSREFLLLKNELKRRKNEVIV